MMQMIDHIQDETVRKQYKYQARIRLSDLFYKFDKTNLRNLLNKRGFKTVLPSLVDETEDNAAKIILGLAVEFPQYFYHVTDRFSELNFANEDYRVFQRSLYALLVEEENRTVSALYAALDDRFYKVLEQVHGHEIVAKKPGNRVLKRRGHALFARYPVAKYNPIEPFVLRSLDYFYLVLQRHAVRRDLEAASQDLMANMNERTELRLNALLSELEVLGALIIEQEKILTEEAAMYTEHDRNLVKTKKAEHYYAEMVD